jgi:hypothetical protein
VVGWERRRTAKDPLPTEIRFTRRARRRGEEIVEKIEWNQSSIITRMIENQGGDMPSKGETKKVFKDLMTDRFEVTRKGRDVFINGYKILAPKGKSTVSSAKMRRAVEAAVKLQK